MKAQETGGPTPRPDSKGLPTYFLTTPEKAQLTLS